MPPSNDEPSADSPPEHARPPLVTPVFHDRLCAAVRTHLRQPISPGKWRETLRPLCLRARNEGVQPEHLLIELKKVVADCCTAAGVRQGAARIELINRLVTIAIEEYFAGDPTRSES